MDYRFFVTKCVFMEKANKCLNVTILKTYLRTNYSSGFATKIQGKIENVKGYLKVFFKRIPTL